MRRTGVLRHTAAYTAVHGVMVVRLHRGWQRWSDRSHLGLLLLPMLRRLHCYVVSRLICRVVEQCPNVVYKKWIKKFGDLLLVGKI